MDISELCETAYSDAKANGWHTAPVNVGTMLVLVHSEVSEACEDWRNGRMEEVFRGNDSKPEGFPSELADIVIRVADMCGVMGIDLEAAIETKMAYNRTRPRRHGGKLA